MNNDGRKRIDALIRDIEKLGDDRIYIEEMLLMATEKLERYKDSMSDIATQIEELKDEESEKFDNMTEGLQQGEKGQAIEAAAQALEQALDAANEIAEMAACSLGMPISVVQPVTILLPECGLHLTGDA